MEPWPRAALLALCAIIALAGLMRHAAQQENTSLALPAAQPLLPLARTAFVLQATSSGRWHDLFAKLQRELGAERVFALIDDESQPFSLYSSEPAVRLHQLHGAVAPHVLLFNESEAWSVAQQRTWAKHEGEVEYFQQPALALLTRYFTSWQPQQADAAPPFDFV